MIFLTDSQLANVQDATPNNVAFFNKQLTRIVSQLFEVKHRELKFREYFTIDNEGGAGITSIEMYVWDSVGSAKIIGHYSDDLPAAGVGGASITVPVRWIGASFHISWMEIQQSTLAGANLSNRRARAADKAIETKLNGVMFGTDLEATEAGLFGLLNHPNIPVSPVADSVANPGQKAWRDKTPGEVYSDVTNALGTIHINTFGVHRADTIALPLEQLNYLMNTRLNDVSSDTIMDAILRNSRYLAGIANVVEMPELAGAGPNGEDVMMVYESGQENAVCYIPYEKGTPMGTLTDGIAFKTPVITSTGGMDVRYPLAFSKQYGI